MFCKETKIDGDFDTKIVLGSGHVLAFQVLWRRHTQAPRKLSQQWNKDTFLGGEFSSFCWRFGGGFGLQESEPGSRHFLAFQVLQHRQTKAGIKKQ